MFYVKNYGSSVSLNSIEQSTEFALLLKQIDKDNKPPSILMLNQYALNMTLLEKIFIKFLKISRKAAVKITAQMSCNHGHINFVTPKFLRRIVQNTFPFKTYTFWLQVFA